MAIASIVMRDEMERLEGRMMVRRFTDELSGETTLERASISVQQEQDALAEEQVTARLRALFEDEDGRSALCTVDAKS